MTLDEAIRRFKNRPSAATAAAVRRETSTYLRDGMIDVETHEHWHDQTRDYVVDQGDEA